MLTPHPNHHYHFVTGRLAESAVRSAVAPLASEFGFQYSIGVMPITVAALMTPRWLRRHLDVPTQATHVIVPGYCDQGLDEIAKTLEIPVICGPKDCRAMVELFGQTLADESLDSYDIQIIAEINHATRWSITEVVNQAKRLRADGADVIDFGCDPTTPCPTIADYIKAIVDEGFRVSVDTFDPDEASMATRAGASLVLSVNSTNREQAVDWGCEVVVIPDAPDEEKKFHETVDFLAKHGVPMRLDPILEPIGASFTPSLLRYAHVRQQYPDFEMMMGIGNLTELSDVDSAGINLLLLGICQELRIHSVLTTQVINWARSSVRECDVARRLVHYSVSHRIPPKNLSRQLVMLRDPKLRTFGKPALDALAKSIKDHNYRIFAEDDQVHLVAHQLHLSDDDPFRLFHTLIQSDPSAEKLDPGHAFYLGYEMAKAAIALNLGKQYEQDESLDWGMLTKPEKHHRLERRKRRRDQSEKP